MVQRAYIVAANTCVFLAVLVAPVHSQTTEGTATATGVSREFNPAISINALFLASGNSGFEDAVTPADGHAAPESGLHLQETEFQFTAAIDPYTSADFIFAFEDGEFGIEEGYVTSGVLSHGIGIRGGQMFAPWGYENPLHTHQLPFVRRSLFGSEVFGEALSEFGAELAWVPATPWFVEVRGAAYNGDSELFDAPGDWDLAYLTGFDTLWDLSDEGTFSLGADYLAGQNANSTDTDKAWTQLAAAVARYKWRSPRGAHSRVFELLAEYQFAQYGAAPGDPDEIARGFYSYANVKFARRWWVEGRFDVLDQQGVESTQRGTFLIAFVPSEFAALRFETSAVSTPDDDYMEFHLQYNFTIGSHPAHKY